MSLLAIAIVILVYLILKFSFKTIIKLLVNAAVGFVIIIVINAFISMVGGEIPLNFLNSLLIGFFGVPMAIIMVVYYLWIK